MRCPSCAHPDVAAPFYQHHSLCMVNVYSGDPRIGWSEVMGWDVSTVALPMYAGEHKGWETMVRHHGLIMSAVLWKNENAARYWHIRTVMDIIRNDGRPAPADYLNPEEELAVLLFGHNFAIWCDVHNQWNTQCGCDL